MNSRVLFLICIILFLAACGGTGNNAESVPEPNTSCSLANYRDSAQPLMEQISKIATETSLSDADSIAAGISSLAVLQTKINGLRCKADFPLKHETLEFSASHLQDAFRAVQAGDLVEANQAIDRAILNAERFNDWTVDVD